LPLGGVAECSRRVMGSLVSHPSRAAWMGHPGSVAWG
jgi:hypothetical protein